MCHLFDTEQPIGIEARRSSLEEASRLARFAIFLPTGLPPALADHEPEIWLSGRQVAVRYRAGSESGLALTYGLWPPGQDPSDYYRDAPEALGIGRRVSVAGLQIHDVDPLDGRIDLAQKFLGRVRGAWGMPYAVAVETLDAHRALNGASGFHASRQFLHDGEGNQLDKKGARKHHQRTSKSQSP